MKLTVEFDSLSKIREKIPPACYDCMLPIARCASALSLHQCPAQLEIDKGVRNLHD